MAGRRILVCVLAVCGAVAAANAYVSTAERRVLVQEAIEDAKRLALQRQTAATMAAHAGRDRGKSGSGRRLQNFKMSSPKTLENGRARVLFEDTVRLAEHKIFEKERHKSSAVDSTARAEQLATELMHKPGSKLTKDETARIFEASGCIEEPPEDYRGCRNPLAIKHRTINGVCNNLRNSLFGSAKRALRRIIPPFYEDGVSQLRGTMQAMAGNYERQNAFSPPYPSARLVSQTVVRDRDNDEPTVSHILMQWGQFLDHDLDEVPAFGECFESDSCKIEGDCAPIPVAGNDPDFGQRSKPCLVFGRSIPVCGTGDVGPRQQVNEITSFIDASQVYGSREDVLDELKDPNNKALLLTGNVLGFTGGKPSLPFVPQEDAKKIVACPGDVSGCFLAGDIRVNEQTSLTVMHTIWMREHNRIAAELGKMNPGWSSDKVFDVTREIVAAEIQHITFNEYLPVILGDEYDNFIGDYQANGGYNPQIDATVPNSFAAAAYRFGHSQVQPQFELLDSSYESNGALSLVEMFFNPSTYEESGGTDQILRGLLTSPTRRVDEFLNNILTSRLFEDEPHTGLDLAALNIQRGRDHGLPSYLVWKKWAERTCNLTSPFRNQLTYIRLMQTYGTLEAIDLWVGGLAETPLSNAQVGATFACIFINTFMPLRHGDRFFYKNVLSGANPTAYFTRTQRDEIGKISLARVICDNADNIKEIQQNAFLNESRVQCDTLPSADLSKFSEDPADEICTVKVALDQVQQSPRLFMSFSRLLTTRRRRTFIQGTDQTTCLPILCPTDNQDVRVLVWSISRCFLSSINQNLPDTSPSRRRGYLAILTLADHIGSDTGVYKSRTDCETGTVNAVEFSCENTDNDEVEVETIKKLESMFEEAEVTESEVDSNSQLLSLLEALVEEDDGASPTGRGQAVGQHGVIETDTTLLAELEEAIEERLD